MIAYCTERFKTAGECLKFLKEYSKENLNNGNHGINLLSNYEMIKIIDYMEIFLNSTVLKKDLIKFIEEN